MEEEGKENSYSSPLANTLVMLYFSSPSFDRWKNSSEDTCPFAAPSGFCPHLPVRADVWGHSLGPQALLVSLSLSISHCCGPFVSAGEQLSFHQVPPIEGEWLTTETSLLTWLLEMRDPGILSSVVTEC